MALTTPTLTLDTPEPLVHLLANPASRGPVQSVLKQLWKTQDIKVAHV